MHELAIAQSVIGIIEAEAKKQNFEKVITIRLSIGELSGIVPEFLEEFFPIASRGTVAEGAVMSFRKVPAAVRCRACGFEGKPEKGFCARCGGSDIKLISGREFYVESIEVE